MCTLFSKGCCLVIVCNLLILLLFVSTSNAASSRRTSIACYDCSSRNYSNKDCHDPVHPAGIKLKEHCKVPKKNHVGLFPALYCIKMMGKSRKTNEEIVVRTCALESMDNSCGVFKFEDEYYEGCILTCTYDGCNGSLSSFTSHLTNLMRTNVVLAVQMVTMALITSCIFV